MVKGRFPFKSKICFFGFFCGGYDFFPEMVFVFELVEDAACACFFGMLFLDDHLIDGELEGTEVLQVGGFGEGFAGFVV